MCTVPVTDEAVRAVEHHVWGGSLWPWHQWRHRWRILAGKPPRLSLWLLHSSQDSLPHPEWRDHTQAHNPRSPNIFTMFDFIHKQLPLFCSARHMSHGKYCRVFAMTPLWKRDCLFKHLKFTVSRDAQLQVVSAHWNSDIRIRVLI